MEEKKAGERLTLEEMFDIFEQDVYKEYREEHGIEILRTEQGIRYIKKYPEGWWHSGKECPSILAFILAEQLMEYELFNELGIKFVIPEDGSLTIEWEVILIQMWVHPLVWAEPEFYMRDFVIGYAAIPTFDRSRVKLAHDLCESHEAFRVLYFADNPITMSKDDFGYGLMKGMHMWNLLTVDYLALYEKVFRGEMLTNEDIDSLKLFNAVHFRNSILFIAKERGEKRAIEILKMLQNEWPKLKMWKNALRNMSKDDIDNFEECLYHGFDDLLEEWEGEETYFPLLTEKCRKEHKVQELEKALQEAYSGSAVTLWKKIKSLISEGYFEDREAQYIYDEWEAYFGKMRYTDRNFRDARNKA